MKCKNCTRSEKKVDNWEPKDGSVNIATGADRMECNTCKNQGQTLTPEDLKFIQEKLLKDTDVTMEEGLKVIEIIKKLKGGD